MQRVRKPIWIRRQHDSFLVALFRDALGGLGIFGVADRAKSRDRQGACYRSRKSISLGLQAANCVYCCTRAGP